jgi:phenylacetate-CoA ligase
MPKNKRQIYDSIPELLKDGLGWGLRRFSKFQWKPTDEERVYFDALGETEFASAEALQNLQLAKLGKLLCDVVEHVPYYRNLFHEMRLAATDICSIADLQKLPLLTKEMIRAKPSDFISDRVKDKDALTEIATGGSSGTPMRYYFDEHMIGVRRATWWRWSRFAGVDLYRDRMVYCGGAPNRWNYPPEDYRGLVSFQRNELVLSSAAMSDRVLDRYIDDIERFKGDYIRGYASGVYMLARRIVENAVVLPMKAILTSSDTLFPQYRNVIEKAFSCKVFDHYGQNEDILTATECGVSSGLHVNVESCIAETVDEEGLPVDGVEGRFVSTHLENYITPLIRYVVGDVGVLDTSWGKCECGRCHQKILEFTGRDDEIVVTPEGRRVGCGSMNQPMKTMYSSIQRCQFIQESLGLLRVKIVPTRNWDNTIHRAEFETNLRQQVGHAIDVNIELVDDIPSRPNGKYQFIISKREKD